MKTAKILLVDENTTITNIYSYLLYKEGYQVVTTHNGVKALEKLHQESFDLIITDITIKNRNGHTLLEEISEQFPLLPKIAMTDNLSEIVKQFAFSLGAFALIEKPCGSAILLTCIKRSLKEVRWYQ